MNNWNKLLAMLDHTLGFPQRKSSRVMKRGQGFDNETQEHVVWLEYRARVVSDKPPEPPLDQSGEKQNRDMGRLRQLAADLAVARRWNR